MSRQHKTNQQTEIVVYQSKSGAIELRGDYQKETMWANLQQIADLFETDKSGISRHIENIYQTDELRRRGTVAKIATVQIEGSRQVTRLIEYYSLDMILSVGYRVNSKKATTFRQWATKTLRQHIVEGYTINKKQIKNNYEAFIQAVDQVKQLLPAGEKVPTSDALELVKQFAATWLSLTAYDQVSLPKAGATKRRVTITAEHISQALQSLKSDLLLKKTASELFGREREAGSLAGIVGAIFQSFAKKDIYPTLEEKAAQLLYLIVKNHPFVDGNKRSGAFAFVWFLQQAGLLDTTKITSQALTALTLLVAESNPKDKQKMIGLILLMLKR